MAPSSEYITEGTYIPNSRPTIKIPDAKASGKPKKKSTPFYVPWQNPTADTPSSDNQ